MFHYVPHLIRTPHGTPSRHYTQKWRKMTPPNHLSNYNDWNRFSSVYWMDKDQEVDILPR